MNANTAAPTKQYRVADRTFGTPVVHVTAFDNDINRVTVRFAIYFPQGETAARDAWVAQFPKSHRVRSNTVSGNDFNWYAGEGPGLGHTTYVSVATGEEGVDYKESKWTLPFAEAEFRLHSGNVTGERNEAATARLTRFLKKLDALGIEWQQEQQNISNWQPTLAEVVAHHQAL